MPRSVLRPSIALLALLSALSVLPDPAGGTAAAAGCAAPPGRHAVVLEPARPGRTLLVALHGYGSNAAALAAASGLAGRAPATGARVVLPDGTGDPARWALAGRLRGGDDLAFVTGLVERCAADGDRVVLAGFSNGAAFAAELACALGDRVDAVLLVGGAGLAAPCPGGHRPLVVAVHGGADRVVPVDGGPVLGGTLHARGLDDAGADRVVIVPGWGHTWPAAATTEALALLA